MVFTTIETQLIALKAALAKIKEWTGINQLILDLDHCVSHCPPLLIGSIDAEIAAFGHLALRFGRPVRGTFALLRPWHLWYR